MTDSVRPGVELLPVAERAWREWESGAASIELISLSENTVFRVEAEGGEVYVLRIHRPGYHDLQELLSEQAWIAALKEANISVPVPLLTPDGRGYVTVRLPSARERRHVGVAHWVEGADLDGILERCDAEGRARHFAELGKLAARIHNQSSVWEIPADFRRHAFDEEGFMGGKPFWGRFWEVPSLEPAQRDLFGRARTAIYPVLAGLPRDRETYGLIHADLHPGNLLVTGGGLHAIDFDDSGFGWHLYEIAVALFNFQDTPGFDQLRDSLIAGYRSERPLVDEVLSLLPMFLLIRALALIGWADQRPEIDRGSWHDEGVALACRQVEAFFL